LHDASPLPSLPIAPTNHPPAVFVITTTVHLAPNAPWLWLLLASLAFAALAIWAYRFAIPPLPALAKRALPALRLLGLLILAWLLARPVLERDRGGRGTRIAVLVDRSWSMDLPVADAGSPSRATAAAQAVADLKRSLRGRATVKEIPFAGRLGSDTTWRASRGATAVGAALTALPMSPEGQDLDGVIVVSDGVTNMGEDPVAAARALGVPVHAVAIGEPGARDRAVLEVEASARVRVGESTPVRVRVTSREEPGTPIPVRLMDGAHELAHGEIAAPAHGAEATAELRVTPTSPGLAVWTAQIDSLRGEITTRNNTRQVAVEVSPNRLGVLIVSSALNWDLTFLRRALAGDSSLEIDTRVRERDGWRGVERSRSAPPTAADLRGRSVVVLDGVAAAEISAEFDAALASFARRGGGVLVLSGEAPGLARFRAGTPGAEFGMAAQGGMRSANPLPTAEGRDLMAWDEDPARGDRAWRTVAPLTNVGAYHLGGGDRPLLGAVDNSTPIMVARRVGRGQVLMVNGTGFWRWSLSGLDEFAADRAHRLWRGLVRWLAEPVQGEPLRVQPERWLSARGEPVRLLASLQDKEFQPVAGATVRGEVVDEHGRRTPMSFEARERGSYVATLDDLAPGRYRVAARATRGGAELGAANGEFAVDRWSLEEARAEPDSAALAALAHNAGGRVTGAANVAAWTRALPARALALRRSDSLRLWESPWVFAMVVGFLSIEWAWRRRRGLP